MAQQQNLMDRKKLCCSICLDLLKDPVTIPCGHNYCMNCISSHWDEEDQRVHSCPQCRQTFSPRPVLVKNTMLADLVEELKKTGLQAAPADHCYAGPGDVACDFCTGRKLKALKSCLQCLVSYCEQHLQPHYESPAFEKHKLVDPSKKLQENVCSHHGVVMKIFCRTDQQCICYFCSVDEHKHHNTVLASAERTERQGELGTTRQKIQQRIQDREKDVKELQQELEAINRSADKAAKSTEKIFAQLVRLIKNRSSDVKQWIRSRQKNKVGRVKELQEKLQQEITELRRRDAELGQLSRTEDHTKFLHSYPSLACLSESTNTPSVNNSPLRYFEDVMAAVSDVRDKLQDILSEVWTKISLTEAEVDVLLPQPEPKTRAEFLQYSQQITLDPNTANMQLLLSDGNRKATVMREKQPYSSHPDRFTDMFQVLSSDALSGRHYWEVERSRCEVSVAVTYKDIGRTGYESGFGNDDKSWALECFNSSYEFRHKSTVTFISGPQSSKIGVYLDHRAGILSFYSVSETMSLLHRVQTTFTQPLHQGLGVFGMYGDGFAAEFVSLSRQK
ncbi:LOW QUALITY PROTEIN: tripartite motif-containing protein 16-like [Lates calcarifer]|uniref:LOW QUALITY PROTEIN: tripartite motif-containing protein 16-like n=1 Tax=Lates calcarifer TaxID=8187 RepID=A0AAJ7V8W1_LATCA|nr:LOW QUALITY PROTEIN: tripartite motif-containing protein 16-like [Lates calcarifer]